MIDIESKVVESLHARADRGVTVDGLRAGALARAGAIRRRRRAARTLAGMSLAAMVGAALVLAPRLLPPGGTERTGTGSRQTSGAATTAGAPRPPNTPGPTTLPERTDVPPAAEHPAAVGTDPGVLHFDVSLEPLKATVSEWTSGPGYESVAISTAESYGAIRIYIGPDANRLEAVRTPPGMYGISPDGTLVPFYEEGAKEPTTVHGRPGTLQKVTAFSREDPRVNMMPAGSRIAGVAAESGGFTWVLRWQPVDGLHAIVQIRSDDQAAAAAAAAALRLDHAQRCTSPMHVTDVPAGAKWTACGIAVSRFPNPDRGVFVHSLITLEQADGHRLTVWAEEARPRASLDTSQFKPNRTVAGHPAQWRAADPAGLWMLGYAPFGEVFVDAPREADALRLAAGLKVVGDLARPETWPERPVG